MKKSTPKYTIVLSFMLLASCSKHISPPAQEGIITPAASNFNSSENNDEQRTISSYNSSNYSGSIIYVNGSAKKKGDGSSWQKAFNNLQEGLNTAANSGAEVWVASGIYRPLSTTKQGQNIGRKATFNIPAGVKVVGSFQLGASDPSEADVQRTPTIFDGNIGNPSVRIDNSFHVVSIGDGAELNNIKIINGHANDSGYNSIGGGVVLAPRTNERGQLVVPANAHITLNRIVFSGNYADQGGALATHGLSSATIKTTYFSDNSAIAGGAMVARGTKLELDNVHFFANKATEKAGAVWFKGGSRATLHSPLFTNNRAGRTGGAILITTNSKQTTETSVQIDDALFSGNRGGEYGGGIANSGQGVLYVTESHMHDNFAENGADIANMNAAQSTTEKCVFIAGRGNFYGSVHGIGNHSGRE